MYLLRHFSNQLLIFESRGKKKLHLPIEFFQKISISMRRAIPYVVETNTQREDRQMYSFHLPFSKPTIPSDLLYNAMPNIYGIQTNTKKGNQPCMHAKKMCSAKCQTTKDDDGKAKGGAEREKKSSHRPTRRQKKSTPANYTLHPCPNPPPHPS